jgi:RecB family endonuclease NucS
MENLVDVKRLTEAELVKHREMFANELGLQIIATEVKIGAYRLDAVAKDTHGHLVVVEFKANASMTTLSQLLLYPHALANAIKNRRRVPPPIRSLLVTTHLDTCLVEVAAKLSMSAHIEMRVCMRDSERGVRLVTPDEAGEQAWDQSNYGPQCIEAVLESLSTSP